MSIDVYIEWWNINIIIRIVTTNYTIDDTLTSKSYS